MKNFLLVWFFGTLIGFGVCLAPLPPRENPAKRATVQVMTDHTWGSGVVVGEGLVVTCRHVVPTVETVVKVRQGESVFDASIVKINEEEDPDLALLSVNEDLGKPVELELHPTTGRLRCYGFPFGWNQCDRQFDSDLIDEGNPVYYLFRAGIYLGDSGSGVFDERGRLLAIVNLVTRYTAKGIRAIHVKGIMR